MTIKYLTSINNSLYNHQFLQDNMIQSTETISENEDESVFNNLCRMTRESTQDECNLKLIQKVLELNNKIFQLQVESHCLNEKINGLTSQIEFRVQSEKILSLQLDLSQSDAHTYKQNIKVLEQLIESMREQKKAIIKQYQQSQNKLRVSIAAKQRDYTTSIQIKQVQTKQRQEEIQDKLEKIKKELKDEKMNNQLLLRKYNQNQQSFQAYYKKYDDLKNMIILKLSQNKEQDPDINFMTQLVTNICIKVQELELEKKKIQQFITIQEGNNQYRKEILFQRIKQNIKFYEGRAKKKQKNLEDVEIALNDLLKSEDISNEFSYGQDLIEKLKNKFIDSKAKYQQLRKNIQDLTQNLKSKDDEIRKLNEKLKQLNQQNQKLKKDWSKCLQDLEKQKKVGENYKKSYQNLISQFQENKASQMQNVSRIQQSFKSVSTKKEQEIQNLKQSLIVAQKKLDDSKNQRQVREKLEQKINQLESDLDAETGRFEQAQNKHRQQIEISNKNWEVQIKKIREQFQVQKKKINSEYDEYKRKYIELEDNNKCITKMIDENKNNLAMKNLKIQQIQQLLCAFVNQARLQRNQSTKNVQTYKQALLALNKLLKDNGAKTGSSLFKIPSISQKNQANIQWVKGIIDQYCGCGLKFQSKFIGKIDENFRDFTKILNNQNPLPNLLLIIQTSKGAVFCMFVTKFTTKINDRDPVVLFSGEKKLKYPSEQKKNQDTRPSIISTQGALQFGKRELTITKMLEMKINLIPAGYFGNVDIQSMYGIQTAAEPLNVQKMEVHQIVF